MTHEVPLSTGLVAVVDAADAWLVREGAWRTVRAKQKAPRWYAVGRVRHQGEVIRTSMHRLILGLAVGEECDHADGNGLNNRRSNLRIATRSQNTANTDRRSRSGYRGVYWARGKWLAQITVNLKNIHLGSFVCPIEAALAYDRAAQKAFGEFARLNFPGVRGADWPLPDRLPPLGPGRAGRGTSSGRRG